MENLYVELVKVLKVIGNDREARALTFKGKIYRIFTYMQETDTDKKAEEPTIGQELVSYVENLKFGTHEFQAVSDYFELKNLRRLLSIEQSHMVGAKDEPAKFQNWMSDVQITSQKIGLLEHEIYLGQSRLEGYSSAYNQIGTGVEEVLLSDCGKEAATKFPDDEKERNSYIDRLYHGAVDRIANTVYRKIEGSKSS